MSYRFRSVVASLSGVLVVGVSACAGHSAVPGSSEPSVSVEITSVTAPSSTPESTESTVPTTMTVPTETTAANEVDTSEEAAVARIARGEMLPMDAMHMIANLEGMTVMLANGEYGPPVLATDESIEEDPRWARRWAQGVLGGWSRVFEAEEFGWGTATVAVFALVFESAENATVFVENYAEYMGSAVLDRSVQGADSGAVVVYRDNIPSERQYRSEALAARGRVAFWAVISSDDSTSHSGGMAAYIVSYSIANWDAMQQAAEGL